MEVETHKSLACFNFTPCLMKEFNLVLMNVCVCIIAAVLIPAVDPLCDSDESCDLSFVN